MSLAALKLDKQESFTSSRSVSMLHTAAILTAEESKEADRSAIATGALAYSLMERAGKAVANLICETYTPRPCLVACGTGNNGGDGFIVARLLKERGWPVEVSIVGEERHIGGDAAKAKQAWLEADGECKGFAELNLGGKQLIVDAILGTGIKGSAEGDTGKAIKAINKSRLPVVSIDIASGVNASDGGVGGEAVKASHTVTFVRPKVGHVLLPGKAHTGTLHVFDIGITGNNLLPSHFLNMPELWQSEFPVPGFDSHKYSRGYSVVVGADMEFSGATRLAATAAGRAGSGAVKIACDEEMLPLYKITLASAMATPIKDLKKLVALLQDERITATLIGPGCGANKTTRERVLSILGLKKACVLDADALSAFNNDSKKLFDSISGPTVITPHEGEFKGLFPEISGNKMMRAQKAAKQCGAVVVLKGSDTVIASPEGKVVINANAPAWLATAGSGDVLAGLITGLLAQGMPPFEAACAGVWLHGRAATIFGPGMIADDLLNKLPTAIREIYFPDERS